MSALPNRAGLWRATAVAAGAALLLAACTQPTPSGAPASATTAVAPSGASKVNPTVVQAGDQGRPKTQLGSWNTVLEAARNEGVVQCGCPPRPDFSRILKEGFEAAYPGIRLEVTAAPLPEFPVRVGKEQEAGQHLWDVYMFGPGPEVFDLKNKGGLADLREYLVGPDVGDDSIWTGGLSSHFLDVEQRHIFGYWLTLNGRVTINRDVLPGANPQTYADLFAPEYKGKIVWVDPRTGGAGSNAAAFIFMTYGRDGLKKLLLDQEALLVKGNTELAEQIVRGGRAVSIPSLSEDTLIPFRQAGVKLNIEDAGGPGMLYGSVGGSSPAVFKNAPHPNATKVFLNWVLSREGQTLLAQKLVQNSARKDVPAGDPPNAPSAGATLWLSQSEESLVKVRAEAQRVARELLP